MFITVEGTYIRWGDDDDGTNSTFMTMLSLAQVLFRLQHPVAGAADRPRGGAQPRPARHAREGRGGQTVSADPLVEIYLLKIVRLLKYTVPAQKV